LNDQQGIDLAKDCLRVARNAGINLFDNAETYGNPTGEAERIMGVAIAQLREEDPVKWRRSDLIITTKVTSSLLAQLIIRPLRSFGVVMV
jgi:aryl-alcohol dehydrogenase-like predicted oxidoreductase